MRSHSAGKKAGLSSNATKSNVKANCDTRTLPGAHKPKAQPAPSSYEILIAAAAASQVVFHVPTTVEICSVPTLTFLLDQSESGEKSVRSEGIRVNGKLVLPVAQIHGEVVNPETRTELEVLARCPAQPTDAPFSSRANQHLTSSSHCKAEDNIVSAICHIPSRSRLVNSRDMNAIFFHPNELCFENHA